MSEIVVADELQNEVGGRGQLFILMLRTECGVSILRMTLLVRVT